MDTKKLIMLIILFVIIFASLDVAIQVLIGLFMAIFIIPGFIVYKLFGKKVAIGYVLLAYAVVSAPLYSRELSTMNDDKELNKSRIYVVLGGIAIFYILNKYLK